MSKCVRCESSFLMRRKVKLKDNLICGKCYNELGFDNYLISDSYTWDDVRDGYDAYWERRNAERRKESAEKHGISVPHYTALKSFGATDSEIKIFSRICAILEDEGRDQDSVEITEEKGALHLSVDGVIFITYKSETDVKWIAFENESPEKIRIGGAGRMNSFAPRIISAFDYASKVN